jgi:23S rRNA (guanosine2251-2'-O)-methyltransferase
MIIYGKQPFLYCITNHKERVKRVFLAKEVDKKTFSLIAKAGVKIERLDPMKAQAMAKGGNHQGFLLEVEEYRVCSDRAYVDADFILILSGITDVGNIGSIVRSAYALGVDCIVIHGLKNPNFSTITRSSSGALLDSKIYIKENVLDFVNELKTNDFTIYAATLEGRDVRQVECNKKKALILGSEGIGLPSRVIKSSHQQVTIQFERVFDSLNVANAAAILLDRMR